MFQYTLPGYKVTKESIMLFAAKHYDSRGATTDEFLEDFAKINSICRSISRQRTGMNINIRLLLNQIVTSSNIFGVGPLTAILLCKVDEDAHCVLYPILVFLGYLSDEQLTDHIVNFDAMTVRKLREL